jgi:hypothetical protein
MLNVALRLDPRPLTTDRKGPVLKKPGSPGAGPSRVGGTSISKCRLSPSRKKLSAYSTIVGRGLFFSLVLACFDH